MAGKSLMTDPIRWSMCKTVLSLALLRFWWQNDKIYLFHRNLCEVGITNIPSVPVMLSTDYFWSERESSFKAFEWEQFCSVISPWIHKHNHNTDDHNTLIYCTYSQSSCLCSSHMAEQQFVSWLNLLRLTTDFLCWNRFFFFPWLLM